MHESERGSPSFPATESVAAGVETLRHFLPAWWRPDVHEGDLAQHVWWTARFADPGSRLQALDVQDYYGDWADRPGRYLRFRSAPLAAPLTVTGHPLLALDFACDQRDAAVFAYLEDIAPDGSAHYVTEGMLRALHRATSRPPETYRTTWPWRAFTRSEAEPLRPGEPVTLEIPLLPVSWEFPAGHRIGLALAGADRDNFALWPYGRPGEWTIRTGPDRSSLTLPVEQGGSATAPDSGDVPGRSRA